jgi:hypothetical protein
MDHGLYLNYNTARRILDNKCFCKIVAEENLEDQTEFFGIANHASLATPAIKTGKFFFYIETVLSEKKLALKEDDLEEYELTLELIGEEEFKNTIYSVFSCFSYLQDSDKGTYKFVNRQFAIPKILIKEILTNMQRNNPLTYSHQKVKNIIGWTD